MPAGCALSSIPSTITSTSQQRGGMATTTEWYPAAIMTNDNDNPFAGIEVIPPGGDIASPPSPPTGSFNQVPFPGVQEGITPGRPNERSRIPPLKPA
jgi:hypothetical protein